MAQNGSSSEIIKVGFDPDSLCDLGLSCPLWVSASPKWAHSAVLRAPVLPWHFLHLLYPVWNGPWCNTETLDTVLSLFKLMLPLKGFKVKRKGQIKYVGRKKETRNRDEMRKRKMNSNCFSGCC